MSSTKTVTVRRRIGLLASSSAVAAGLAAVVSIGAAVLPSSAAAQSVCTPTPQVGAGTNNVTYTSGSSGITCTATGALTVNAGTASARRDVNGPVNFSGVPGGVNFVILTPELNSFSGFGGWHATGTSLFGGGNDVVTILGVGQNTLQGGSIDFGAGNDVFNVSGDRTGGLSGVRRLALTNGTVNFGSGADALTVTSTFSATGGSINFGADADTFTVAETGIAEVSTLVDFGSGADVFDQDGALYVTSQSSFVNLEAFNNSGAILLGGEANALWETFTDGVPSTAFRFSSGAFTGSDGGSIVIDANLGTSGSQLDCSTPTVADCADFTGATTAGVTLVTVRDSTFDLDSGTLGAVITLVEGATAEEHFILDPASTFYAETASGASIRKPVVEYRFMFDEATGRHLLVGAPGAEMFEVGTFGAAAQETWRATTGSWLTRQADLRATPGGLESSRGFWGRIGGQAGERELGISYDVPGLTLDYDLTHKQKIGHLVFGADLLGADNEAGAWVLGGMLGYVRSDVEYEATTTEMTATGATGGLYASYVAGPLFIDAVFNANLLHVKMDAPAMNLGLDVPMRFDLTSVGGQVEGGWRIPLGQGLFVEPLAGVSYVITNIEDTEVPGGSGTFDFGESKSLRAGVGARLGMDADLMGMVASYGLTGRYWTESEGESSTTVSTASGSSAVLPDEFAGEFSEIAASVSLYSDGGGLSGFVNLGGKFADDYQAIDGAVGVRLRW